MVDVFDLFKSDMGVEYGQLPFSSIRRSKGHINDGKQLEHFVYR